MITGGESLVSHAGGALLVETARRNGLAKESSARCRAWRRPLAVHDPGKIVLDLALMVALGGDTAWDLGVLRAPPGLFGLVASRWPGYCPRHVAGTCSSLPAHSYDGTPRDQTTRDRHAPQVPTPTHLTVTAQGDGAHGGREPRRGATHASPENSPAWAARSAPPPSGRFSHAPVSIRPRDARYSSWHG